MNDESNKYIVPAYLSTVLFKNNLINRKSIQPESIQPDTNKKERLTFYENNIHHYYNYNLIKKLLENFGSFSDFNELSYKHLNQDEQETYKSEMIQYQNEIIIKTLIRIFDNRKIEYENEKIAAEEARKKSEEARKKAEEARKKADEADRSTPETIGRDAQKGRRS
jgi:hypothetical protein